MRIEIKADLVDSGLGLVILDIPELRPTHVTGLSPRLEDTETGVHRELTRAELWEFETKIDEFRMALTARALAELIRSAG